VEAELVPVNEGSIRIAAMRGDQTPPGSRNTSRTEDQRRDLGDPDGSIGRSSMGAAREGRPQRAAEPSPGVGPLHSTDEVLEGNEGAEGRRRPGRIPLRSTLDRTQGRATQRERLQRVNDLAKRDKRVRFTALLHHVDVHALRRAFARLKRGASAGVDGLTVQSYEQALEDNLQRLHERVHSGRYRPLPVRRAYIPKSDGGQRPLGVPALEDKILQGAVAEVLSAIYEADFLGFSYGFRPGRSPHQALASLHKALMTQKVNWVLDADIRRFFDSVDHEWMLRMVAHRIADPRVLRLIELWLKAGVLERGVVQESTQGTPQGSGISPLLANVFLHYVLDLWVNRWRRTRTRDRVIVVRYCDDFVMGFQSAADARRMLDELSQRLRKFELALHDDKTRLIPFGSLMATDRRRQGLPRLPTFAFLGFTHYGAWSREGRFVVKRRTQGSRLTVKLKALRVTAHQRMHAPIGRQHDWLCSVLRGHYAYYGLRSNISCLETFYQEVRRIWFRALHRRSQRGLSWAAYARLLERFPLPTPSIREPATSAHV
jgi:RNA-directed DNA polymerase